MDPITITLRSPIAFGSETIATLTIRPPTGKDFRRLPVVGGFELDTILTLASRLSGQPDVVIDKLVGEDLEEVIDLVSGFMPGSRRTGSKPSGT